MSDPAESSAAPAPGPETDPEPGPDPGPAPGRPPIVATAAIVLVVALGIALLVSADIPFDRDEANHANIGLRQYQDLVGGDLMDFVRHSYRTGRFPFLHGWMLLPSFAIFGTTVFAARVAQVALFVIGCGATGWAAFRVADDDHGAGCVGMLLFALSPKLATLAGLCMLEVPGAAMTAVSLAVFAEALRGGGRRAVLLHLLTACAVLATCFTQLTYGLWIAPAVGVGYAVGLINEERRRHLLRMGLLYTGVLAAVAVIWYSTDVQRQAFVGFLTNPAERGVVEAGDPGFGLPALSWSHFTAYFRSVPESFYVDWVVGWVVFGGFAVGLLRRGVLNRPLVIASAACVIWTWLVLSTGFREDALPRFIATALPPLWIVAAGPLARMAKGVGSDHLKRIIVGAVVLLAVGVQLMRLPLGLKREYDVGTEFRPVFDFVCEHVPARSSVAVVNDTDHTAARTFEWELSSLPGRTYRDHDVRGFTAEEVFESDERLRAWFADARPWGASGWGSYVVEVVPAKDFPDPAVPGTIALWHAVIESKGDRLERIASQDFPGVHAEIVIWRDREPPRHEGLGGGK